MLPDKDGPGGGGCQQTASALGEDPSVSLFREYLRLRTVHPDPDYGRLVACFSPCYCIIYQSLFLIRLLSDIRLCESAGSVPIDQIEMGSNFRCMT